jgi:hypothetical protein
MTKMAAPALEQGPLAERIARGVSEFLDRQRGWPLLCLPNLATLSAPLMSGSYRVRRVTSRADIYVVRLEYCVVYNFLQLSVVIDELIVSARGRFATKVEVNPTLYIAKDITCDSDKVTSLIQIYSGNGPGPCPW